MTETRVVLITGITGMDGSHMADMLLAKGYEIHGLVRRISQPNLTNIQHLVDDDCINLIGGDLADQSSINNAINLSEPEELYHFGAQSYVGTSWNQAEFTSNITGLGSLRVFDAVKHSRIKDRIRILQASSSEMYGNVSGVLNEDSVMRPRSPYGVSKLFAHNMARVYRESFDMLISCSISFNHTGERRGIEFASRKIANGVAKIKLGLSKELVLGNLDAKRDFGYAKDYIEIMWTMLQQDKPDDFVIATGLSHTIRDFVDKAFGCVGLDWQEYVAIDKNLYRPAEIYNLEGDAGKINRMLGWKPKTTFDEFIQIMVNSEINRMSSEIK
jgi:GDPmannose 4,6-dehydratase